MCDYITAILAAGTDLDGLEPILKRHHLDFSLIPNENVTSQLKPGESYHHATRSVCDCGTALGSLAASGETRGDSDRALSRKVRKLESKGWSRSKIDRWIAQKNWTEAKRERTAYHQEQWTREHYTADAERWLAILNEMLNSGKTRAVGLLIHWYSGRLESERIHIKKRDKTRVRDASPEMMLHLEHDVLYEFTI